jgi:NADP-dependent 3-hydroxy acid dehydrogenase YdfG
VLIFNAGTRQSFTAPLSMNSVGNWKRLLDYNILAFNGSVQAAIKVLDGQIIALASQYEGNCNYLRYYNGIKTMIKSLFDGWKLELREIGSNWLFFYIKLIST